MTARQPNPEQKTFIAKDVSAAIVRICDAWRPAVLSVAARGFSTGQASSEGKTAGTHGDPTGNCAAGREDIAYRWLIDSRRALRRLRSDADPAMPGQLCVAADKLVDLWPEGISHLFNELRRLSALAGKHWPPTPRPGVVIDGIKVGERGTQVESCTECRGPIAGGAADPIRRLDGRPFHKAPCYETARKRRQRASARPEGVGQSHSA